LTEIPFPPVCRYSALRCKDRTRQLPAPNASVKRQLTAPTDATIHGTQTSNLLKYQVINYNAA